MTKSNLTGKLMLVLLFLGSGFSWGQNQFIKEYDIDFIWQSMSNQTEAYAKFLDKTPSGYVISGPTNLAGNIDPVLIGLDDLGNSNGLLSKRYVINNTQEWQSHVTTIAGQSSKSDIGFIISGDYTDLTDQSRWNYFIKTDHNGDVVWSKKYQIQSWLGNYTHFNMSEVRQVSNGDLIIAGHIFEANGSDVVQSDVIIMKMNPFNGQIIWSKVYGSQNLNNSMILNGFIEGAGGHYYFYGSENEDNNTASFVLHLYDNGSGGPVLSNFKEINFTSGTITKGMRINSMVYHNNLLYAAGNIHWGESSQNDHAICLFKIDLQLNEISTLTDTAGSFNLYLQTQGYGHEVSELLIKNERPVIVGTTSMDPGNGYTYPYYTLVLSENGDPINLAYSNHNSFNSVNGNTIETTNGYVGGFILDDPGKVRLTQFQSLGNSCDQFKVNTGQGTGLAQISTANIELSSRSKNYINLEVTTTSFEYTVSEVCTGCPDGITSDQITSNTGSFTFCEGDNFILTAPSGYGGYTWLYDGNVVGAGQTHLPQMSGDYKVVMYQGSCEFEVSQEVIMHESCPLVYTIPKVTYCSIDQESTPEFIGWSWDVMEDCNSIYNYQWYYNGAETTGFNNTAFQGPGVYEVVVTTICGTYSQSLSVADQYQVINEVNSPGHPYLPFASLDIYDAGTAWFSITQPDPIPSSIDLIEWEITDGTVSQITYGPAAAFNYNGEGLTIIAKLYDYETCTVYLNTSTWDNPPPSTTRRGPSQLNEAKEGTEFDITIFPNPTTGLANIIMGSIDSEEGVAINVYSLDGKLILTEMVYTNFYPLDIKPFKSGVYLIEIQNGNQIQLERIIKE